MEVDAPGFREVRGVVPVTLRLPLAGAGVWVSVWVMLREGRREGVEMAMDDEVVERAREERVRGLPGVFMIFGVLVVVATIAARLLCGLWNDTGDCDITTGDGFSLSLSLSFSFSFSLSSPSCH